MDPSIWSTPDRAVFVVTTGTDPTAQLGKIRKTAEGWVIVDDSQGRPAFPKMQDAANALAGTADVEYKDYLLGNGEEAYTVYTTVEQVRLITESGWQMISASAPRRDDVN